MKTIMRIAAMTIGVVAGVLGVVALVMIGITSMISFCFSGMNPSREEEKYVIISLSEERN